MKKPVIKTDALNNINFIEGLNDISYSFTKDKNNINHLVVKVLNGDTTGEYHPNDFISYFYMSYCDKIDKNKNRGERIKLAYEAKMKIIHIVENLKEQIEVLTQENGTFENYDFSGTLNKIEVVIDCEKLELDSKKYDLEIDKLEFEKKKLRFETHWFIKWLPYILSAIAVLISFSSIIVSIWLNKNTDPKPKMPIQENKITNQQSNYTFKKDSLYKNNASSTKK